MPVFLDPNKTFRVSLDSDADKPIESRPHFIAKTQSMRGQLAIFDVLDQMRSDTVTAKELFDKTVDKLAEVIVGWSNMPMEYSREALLDVLSYTEARSLLTKIAYNIEMDEKKSFE